jgi:hypothetical protein
MNTSIKSLSLKIQKVKEKRHLITKKFCEFEALIIDSVSGTEVRGKSGSINLEQTGYDDYVYGYLCADENGVSVAHRSTQDDHFDAFNGIHESERSYSLKHFGLCPVSWLEKLFSEKSISSLLADLNSKADELDAFISQSVSTMEKFLENESAEIDKQMVATLKKMEDDQLRKSWIASRQAVNLDTADALTRGSSFLESVCKKILRERKVDLQQTITMATLIEGCIKTLKWPDDPILREDMKKISGGVKSISGGVAGLRTHF